ncbi:hypothetical protein GYMLUDRAFT_69984 [Collybiopsis luxurians FD-317 M1]|nr:hypothetical protein GYMLUDRAFT_69984 [Collybiopsis luxurians FD-317 M1]
MSSPSNAFHLRPVSASESPTASSSGSSPTAEKVNMRTFREGDSSVVLRDLDLDTTLRGKFPNLPAPPTGHDLMAMFPPPAPSLVLPNRRTEATSGYFHLQERAYFAQAGREIIRVRVDVDVRDMAMDVDDRKHDDKRQIRNMELGRREEDARGMAPHISPRLTTMHSPRDHHREEIEHVSPREHHARPSIPTLRRMSIDASHQHSPPKQRYPYTPEESDPRELRLTPSEYPNSAFPHPDESDEAWRRPMPYAERRRAGKHTRRVIVKN